MSNIDSLRLDGRMSRESSTTDAEASRAPSAEPGAPGAQASGTTGRLERSVVEELAPEVAVRGDRPSLREALTALRSQHPQRAARLLIAGRSRGALRRLNVSPRELDARLQRAGFRDHEIAAVHEALDQEIGQRFQSMVRSDGLRIVERLARELELATRGDSPALQRLEDELFSARGPEFVQRLRLAGAETEGLDAILLRGDREAARPLLRDAVRRIHARVQEQADLIRNADEGAADPWGSAYRAFETSVQRQSNALGLHPNAAAELKDATVLERAVHRSVTQSRARHEEAVETGRGIFDTAMSLVGYSAVAGARGVVERRMETVDAQRRAIAGNGSLASAREAETREMVGAARALGEAALGSLVEGMVAEAIADADATELLADAVEELGDRVYEKLTALPFMTPGRETVRALVRWAVDEAMGAARDEALPDEAVERALR